MEALTGMPRPYMSGRTERQKLLKQLRSFLGLASYNRRYVKDCSKIVAPLSRLLGKYAQLKWNDDCEAAWQTIINAIAESRGVFHPDYDLPFHLRVDARAGGVGGYLFQRAAVEKNGKTRIEGRVIEYSSRSLPKTIRCYDARRLDLLAILEALELPSHHRRTPYKPGDRPSVLTVLAVESNGEWPARALVHAPGPVQL